jgi:hypothetical protein
MLHLYGRSCNSIHIQFTNIGMVLWNRDDMLRFRFRLWKCFGPEQLHKILPFHRQKESWPIIFDVFLLLYVLYVGSGSKSGSGIGSGTESGTVMHSGSAYCSCNSGFRLYTNVKKVVYKEFYKLYCIQKGNFVKKIEVGR